MSMGLTGWWIGIEDGRSESISRVLSRLTTFIGHELDGFGNWPNKARFKQQIDTGKSARPIYGFNRLSITFHPAIGILTPPSPESISSVSPPPSFSGLEKKKKLLKTYGCA